MKELPAGELERILPLVPSHEVAGHMAFVHAVVEGSMPGCVFVDDVERPGWAIACNLTGFWHAIGEAPAGLMADDLRPVLARVPAEMPTGLWAATGRWREVLLPLFERNAERHEFTFDAAAGREQPLPAGFELRPLDAGLARQFGRGTDPWVVEIWGGAEEFARRAFGVAAVRDGGLAGFCTLCALQEGVEAEIEIGTAPEYRGMGLAAATGAAFIAMCRERGLLPAWTCAADNAASFATALRLGFRPLRSVTGFPLGSHMAIAGGKWQNPAPPGPPPTS